MPCFCRSFLYTFAILTRNYLSSALLKIEIKVTYIDMIIEFLVKKVLLVNLTKNRLGCQMMTKVAQLLSMSTLPLVNSRNFKVLKNSQIITKVPNKWWYQIYS